jgi:transcriptional regulator with XRE-family HTH domain
MSTMHIHGSQDLGQLIAAARRRKGLSQRQVADTLKVTQAWVSRVERGSQKAWIGQVLRLAAFLDVQFWGSPDSDAETQVNAGTRSSPAHDLDKLLEL